MLIEVTNPSGHPLYIDPEFVAHIVPNNHGFAVLVMKDGSREVTGNSTRDVHRFLFDDPKGEFLSEILLDNTAHAPGALLRCEPDLPRIVAGLVDCLEKAVPILAMRAVHAPENLEAKKNYEDAVQTLEIAYGKRLAK